MVEFKEPRFYLHLYESPESVMSRLRADGPLLQTKEQLGHANADFVISGTGDVYWGTRIIKVEADSISIDGTYIASQTSDYRNVTIDTDGAIRNDYFIPFEPIWGYHPRP